MTEDDLLVILFCLHHLEAARKDAEMWETNLRQFVKAAAGIEFDAMPKDYLKHWRRMAREFLKPSDAGEAPASSS